MCASAKTLMLIEKGEGCKQNPGTGKSGIGKTGNK